MNQDPTPSPTHYSDPWFQCVCVCVCVALFCWPDIGESNGPGSFLKSGDLGLPDFWVGVNFFFGGKIVAGVIDPPPPPRNFEGMGMGSGIHGEWQTQWQNTQRFPDHSQMPFSEWQREWPSLLRSSCLSFLWGRIPFNPLDSADGTVLLCPEGLADLFFPTPMTKPPRGPPPPPPPPFTSKRHDFEILAPKIALKFKYMALTRQQMALNSNSTDKIQVK